MKTVHVVVKDGKILTIPIHKDGWSKSLIWGKLYDNYVEALIAASLKGGKVKTMNAEEYTIALATKTSLTAMLAFKAFQTPMN